LAEGSVSSHSPYIAVRIRIQDFILETEAFVDTGFDGGILLPPLRLLDLAPTNLLRTFTLGDGRAVPLPAYRGQLEVVGIATSIETIIAIGAPEILLGRQVLDHFRVTFDHGREVIVEA
jgi:predicted aspartyl protease